jgi:hypothetical protein
MTIKIKPKNKKDTLELIKQSHSKFSKGSFSLVGINIIRYNENIYALSNLIDIDGYKNNDLKRRFIDNAVKKTKNYKKINIYNFKRRLIKEINNHENKPKKDYWVIFPTNIRYAPPISQKNRFKLGDITFYLRDFGLLRRNFNLNPIQKIPPFQNNFSKFFPILNLFILIKEKGRNIDEVINNSYSKYELLISIINFIKASRTFVMFRSNAAATPNFIELFPPEYMFIFNDKRKYETYFFTIEKHDRRNTTINQNHCNAIFSSIKNFNNKAENELKEILINSLVLYNSALERTHKHHMFLTFWQVIETIALSDLRTRNLTDFITNRIKIAGLHNQVNEHLIDEVCQRRHELVHSGRVDIEDIDLWYVKLFAETCIQFLWGKTDEFQKKTVLEKYYKYVNVNHTELNERKFVIDKII